MATRVKQSASTIGAAERKVVIVHRRALVDKYKSAGYSRIRLALDALITHDRSRGINTKIALVDSLVPLGGTAATFARNAGKFKSAVDLIYKRKRAPEYLVLLGGPDVIPHVSLRSPWGKVTPWGEESFIESDLPYASDRPHSLDPSKFQNAQRRIGRIPDMPGALDPQYLIDRLNDAIAAPTVNPVQHFSLTADVWKGASKEIATRLFGAGAIVHCSPALGPAWTSNLLKKPIQYINCHGDTKKDVFYGEKAGAHGPLPHAINAAALAKKVVRGAVVVAECCYGAELFTPSLPHEPQGMALTYLEEGATTFLGSSTVSYGGAQAADLACADELCLYFLENVLKGSSCGAALVDARRRLVEGQAILDNYQIKTLAQFILLGDPARRPVETRPKQATKRALAVKGGKALPVKSLLAVTPKPKIREKVRALPVASQVMQVALASKIPHIPMPKGVPYTARLYTSAGRQDRGAEAGLLAKVGRGKSLRSIPTDGVDTAPAVLVVSIPNDPRVIADMRRLWGRAATELKSAPLVVRSASKTAVMQDVPDNRADSETLELSAFAAAKLRSGSVNPGRLFAFSRRAAARSRPNLARRLSEVAIGEGSEGSEHFGRNNNAVLVARIANGQIQSYKVLVAR